MPTASNNHHHPLSLLLGTKQHLGPLILAHLLVAEGPSPCFLSAAPILPAWPSPSRAVNSPSPSCPSTPRTADRLVRRSFITASVFGVGVSRPNGEQHVRHPPLRLGCVSVYLSTARNWIEMRIRRLGDSLTSSLALVLLANFFVVGPGCPQGLDHPNV
ncbi:uncharacterized protein IWZ02DRAFT_266590 [Phyllosticta citriasiana]|uniref:uncharacterized protein n=1 Tax=Phyllosticta citriasiana TaxID=595635 RepID=UPI0030FD8581